LYQNDHRRTGHYDYPAIVDPAGVHWRADLIGQIFGAPMYADGLLYVNGSNKIYVFDGQTGEQLSTLDGLGMPFSPIAISGELLIAGATSPARLLAYDRYNQQQVWAFDTAGEIYNSPLVVGQTVYAVSERGAYALDLATGQVIWQTDTGDHRGFVGSPAYENGRLFASVGPSLFALDGETGESHWQLDQQEDQWFYSPALANDWVYVGSDDGHFYALDQQTGEEKWQSQEAGVGWSAPVITNDLVIVGNIDQHIYAFDALTGEERWRFETVDWAVSDPVTSDGVVYVGVGNHENRDGPRPLYALDAETGVLLWSFEADSRLMTAATLAPGIVYVVAVNGTVYALSPPGDGSAPVLQPGQWSAMVYHEGLEQIVLVNGGPEEGKPADEPLELWGWNGEMWTLIDNSGPVWRNWAGVAYDNDRDVLVVHGGAQANNEYFDETWEWDGQSWTQHDGEGPGGREGAGMVYDSGRARVVLYGGAVAGPEIVGDTWEWDGQTWVPVAASEPPARFPAGTVYDPIRQQLLIYGGHDVRTSEEIPFLHDFWAWDGAEWRELPLTEPNPGIRVATSLVFDPVTEELLMFGGADLDTFRSDLWGWDGRQWTLISYETGMPVRSGFNIVAYDPGRDVFVMFGGVGRPGGEVVGETWEWDRVTWRCLAECED
jgi:outer membrane protein assembly factor BamB